MHDIREWMRLIESEQTPAEQMIEAFEDALEASPLNGKVGVDLWHHPNEGSNIVELSYIKTMSQEDRGKRYASQTMQLLCNFADKYGITLTLGVAEDAEGDHDTLNSEQLLDWYEKWGFEGSFARMSRKPDEPLDEDREYSEDDVAERRQKMRGKSLNGYVVIYRALPANNSNFMPMSYITMSRKFAIEHAESNAVYYDEDFHVIRKMVDGRHVYEAPNPGEYFYDGPEIAGKTIYVAKA